jgi:hypothetical protein
MRLRVEVLAADRAETGTVGTAEDLVRQRERDGIVRPGGQVEAIVVEVLGSLVVALGLRRLVFTQPELER